MIRSEPVAEIIRFYDIESDDPYADYVAVCTIVWETKDIVWIKAMNDRGVKKARASRVHGKRLPFSENCGEYQEIMLDNVIARMMKKV